MYLYLYIILLNIQIFFHTFMKKVFNENRSRIALYFCVAFKAQFTSKLEQFNYLKIGPYNLTFLLKRNHSIDGKQF